MRHGFIPILKKFSRVFTRMSMDRLKCKDITDIIEEKFIIEIKAISL